MKKLLTLTNVIGAAALLALASGCATTTANNTAIDTSHKEMLLSKAGFIPKTVTTPTQQQQVEKLPVGVVSAVKVKGRLYYVYPTAKKDQVFVGRQAQYDSYKNMLRAIAAKAQANAAAQQSTAQPTIAQDTGAYLSGETAGPNRVIVQEFDGFGPMQDNPAWQ